MKADQDHRSEFRLEKMCKVLHVSRSGYYKWQASDASKKEKRREPLTAPIKWHFSILKKSTAAQGYTMNWWKKAGRYRNEPLVSSCEKMGCARAWRANLESSLQTPITICPSHHIIGSGLLCNKAKWKLGRWHYLHPSRKGNLYLGQHYGSIHKTDRWMKAQR